MSGDEGGWPLHAERVLSASSPPCAADPVHAHRVATSSLAEGKLSMTWGLINKPPSSSSHPPVLSMPLLLYIFYAERAIEKQCRVEKKENKKAPLFASLINLPNDFPYREGEPPKDDSRSPRRWCGAWKQRGWNEGGQVTGFRWALLWPEWVLRLCVSAGESAQWVTGHSAGWMASWCGHLDSLPAERFTAPLSDCAPQKSTTESFSHRCRRRRHPLLFSARLPSSGFPLVSTDSEWNNLYS